MSAITIDPLVILLLGMQIGTLLAIRSMPQRRVLRAKRRALPRKK